MVKVFKTRNKIIIFELLLLIVMLIISYKIYVSQQTLTKLSKNRIEMIFSIHKLGHKMRYLTTLTKEYLLTKDKNLKKKYFYTIKNGYSLVDKVENDSLYKNLTILPFSLKEKDFINIIFENLKILVSLQNKSIILFDNNHQKEANAIINSKNYKNIQSNILLKIKQIITSLNKRMENNIQRQNEIIYYWFFLLATIGTLFVFINIYFFIYLSNLAIIELREKEKLIKKVENFSDILEDKVEKRTEKIKELMKVKSEFLANMSHEIRTPLNAMFGFIRILQEKDFDDESKKYLSIIEKSGQNLLTIINDILDFSKIEAGKLNIEKVEFNPKEEIEVIYNLFKGLASQKNITLKVNETLKYNIISDPVRLKQVIANLLSNAIKFSESGKEVILNISYFEEEEKLCVEVIDEGIGISQEKLIHIFDAFSQADNSTTRKYGGTGLGLTISYKLIQLLGGELKVKSELKKGSKFYFTIKAPKTNKITKQEIEKKGVISSKQFDGYILLVEDNKANQLFMKVVLKKMGMVFDIVNDGLEAIKKFEEFKYDVILMDENMPNMDGIEATKKIRMIEREKHLNHTPIIALTANAMEGDKERFIKAGMDYYLSKPLEIEKLQDILENI